MAVSADVAGVEVGREVGLYVYVTEGNAGIAYASETTEEPLFDVIHHAVVLRKALHGPIFRRGGIALFHPLAIATDVPS